MLNPNKKIHDMDDRPKNWAEIREMIENMLETDEDGNPEVDNKSGDKVIA